MLVFKMLLLPKAEHVYYYFYYHDNNNILQLFICFVWSSMCRTSLQCMSVAQRDSVQFQYPHCCLRVPQVSSVALQLLHNVGLQWIWNLFIVLRVFDGMLLLRGNQMITMEYYFLFLLSGVVVYPYDQWDWRQYCRQYTSAVQRKGVTPLDVHAAKGADNPCCKGIQLALFDFFARMPRLLSASCLLAPACLFSWGSSSQRSGFTSAFVELHKVPATPVF